MHSFGLIVVGIDMEVSGLGTANHSVNFGSGQLVFEIRGSWFPEHLHSLNYLATHLPAHMLRAHKRVLGL